MTGAPALTYQRLLTEHPVEDYLNDLTAGSHLDGEVTVTSLEARRLTG